MPHEPQQRQARLASEFAILERRMDGVDQTWKKRASCQNSDPDIFFDPDREAEALAYCERCPVTDPCLHFGLTIHNRHDGIEGVWGGLDAVQVRRALRTFKKTSAAAAS